MTLQPREQPKGVPVGWALPPPTQQDQLPFPELPPDETRAQASRLGPAASNYALHRALEVEAAAEAGR